jgi:hypothetical protein
MTPYHGLFDTTFINIIAFVKGSKVVRTPPPFVALPACHLCSATLW